LMLGCTTDFSVIVFSPFPFWRIRHRATKKVPAN
jgi:hypothetical protein